MFILQYYYVTNFIVADNIEKDENFYFILLAKCRVRKKSHLYYRYEFTGDIR
jgi:hypothetical protein